MIDICIRAGEQKLAASVYGDAALPPVLLLHGIGMSRDSWFDTAMELCDHYRVWTLDFRGHGHSDPAASYLIGDYAKDAKAALEAIGRPAFVLGHSMGGVVAGTLSQAAHPLVSRVLMLDPPWYFGRPEEFARTPFPMQFAALRAFLTKLRKINASLNAYIDLVANTPHPKGGTIADHASARHVLSQASGYQRMDPSCWLRDRFELFDAVDTASPFRVPTEIIRADARYGAAFLDDHADKIRTVNPDLSITHYVGSDHFPMRSFAFEERFAADLAQRLAAWRAVKAS